MILFVIIGLREANDTASSIWSQGISACIRERYERQVIKLSNIFIFFLISFYFLQRLCKMAAFYGSNIFFLLKITHSVNVRAFLSLNF